MIIRGKVDRIYTSLINNKRIVISSIILQEYGKAWSIQFIPVVSLVQIQFPLLEGSADADPFSVIVEVELLCKLC